MKTLNAWLAENRRTNNIQTHWKEMWLIYMHLMYHTSSVNEALNYRTSIKDFSLDTQKFPNLVPFERASLHYLYGYSWKFER